MDEKKNSEALAEESLDAVSGGAFWDKSRFDRIIESGSNEHRALLQGRCPFCQGWAFSYYTGCIVKEAYRCSGTCGTIAVE